MKAEPILECVPNFSEGTSLEIVRQIVASMRVDGVRLLDYSLDHDHNRSVVTIAGTPAAVIEAAVLAAGKAAGISIAEAALLARQAGLQIWRRFGVPVYFYGAAAARPDRFQLEDVRRGQFEGLREAAIKDATRRPDVGGPELHPTAGASVVGARTFLIAYNVYLAPRSEITHARAIARDIRASSGGMQGVKALGVLVNGRAQVTMNVTNFQLTPMPDVYAMVEKLAKYHGVSLAESELIGLVPERAYTDGAKWAMAIPGFDPEQKILERRLQHPIEWPEV
jgi:glutamate formiminotransferase